MSGLAPPVLRARLRRMRDAVRADIDRIAALRAVAERREEIDEVLDDLDRQLERIDAAAVITLVGATGAGKSTLLNALAGRTVAEEGVDRPTTRRPTIYAPPEADVSGLLAAVATAAPELVGDGAALVVRHSSPGPWASHVLIDAPDINSIDRSHRAVVTALVERSDVLVVVLHHQSVVEAAAVSFLDQFAGRRRLVFVLNRCDELTPEAREALLAQTRALAAERFGAADAPVVALSARQAKDTPAPPEWLAFRTILPQLTREPALRTARRLNALGSAARLSTLFADVRRAVTPELAALPDEAADGLAVLARRAGDNVAVRLALRRPDLTALLCGEAARRWDGPGGWALRAGGPAALGMGAAGLLLRRHPLTAAGAAIGTLAADRLGAARRAERVSDADPLAPAANDLAAWYGEALAAARLRTARLAGAPEAFDLPSLATVSAHVSAAVDDAWSQLVDVDLPAAAARSCLRFVRWPLDLPVYAFSAWMLYRVGAAFVAGSYAGVDFLLNAALLLGAYLLGVRWIVRAGLRWRADRLASRVVEHVGTALTTLAERAQAQVRTGVDEQQATLERLCTLAELWQGELGTS